MAARWKGLRKLERDLNQLGKKLAGPVLRQRLREEAEEIATDVEASRPGKGIPRDRGQLAASISVEGPSRGKNPRVLLSAGGQAAPYALVQHEDLTFFHNLGESKYWIRGAERRQRGGTASKALAEQMRALPEVS